MNVAVVEHALKLIKIGKKETTMINVMSKETMDKIHKIVDVYTNTKSDNSLFHFTSVNALHSIIENQSLRLTNSTFMNDKNEYLDSLMTVVKAAREMKNDERYQEDKDILIDMESYYIMMIEDYQSRLEDVGHSVFYILSTSMDFNSVPMWNYYSDGSGICIEFDKTTLNSLISEKINMCNKKNVFENNHASYFKCLYDESIKIELIKKIIDISLPEINRDYDKNKQNKKHGLYVYFANAIREYSYIFKNSIYKYENEHRAVVEFIVDDNIINELDKSKHINKHFYTVRDTIRPCITICFNQKLPIKSVYIAPTNTSETVVRGIKLLLKHYGYQDINVDKVKMSIRNNY